MFSIKKENPIYERAKSPFFGAYIISWCIINWEIILTIFFSNSAERGGISIVDFIETNYLSICNSIIYPLALTIFYIFIGTKIDYFTFSYLEKERQKKVEKKVEIQKSYAVSGETHINALKKIIEEQKAFLELKKESIESLSKIESLNLKVSNLEIEKIDDVNSINNLKNSIEKFYQSTDITKHISGKWKVTLSTNNHGHSTLYYDINPHSIQITQNMSPFGNYTISHFFRHPNSNKIYIISFDSTSTGRTPLILDLTYISSKFLSGSQNGISFIEMEKMIDDD